MQRQADADGEEERRTADVEASPTPALPPVDSVESTEDTPEDVAENTTVV